MNANRGPRANRQPLRRRIANPTVSATICFAPGLTSAQPIAEAALVLPYPWLLAGTAALAALVAALVAGVSVALRAHRKTGGVVEELRQARARASSLEPLLSVWTWETDRDHRLRAARPPRGVAPADGALPTQKEATDAPPKFLWEGFRCEDWASLRSRLDGAAPLDGWPASLGGPGESPRTGLLHGRAWVDAAGRFAGYHGTFDEQPALATAAVSVVSAVSAVAAAAAVPAPQPDASTVSPESFPAAGAGRWTMGADDDRDAFSFTVSHDLRAPIRVVEGFTKIVKEDYGRLLDRVGNDHLDRVLGAASRMNNMIDALLSLSKLSSQPLAHQPVNLSQLAGYVSDDLRRQWPERHVTLAIAPGMQVVGDPTLLRVVVENLLANAWKYTAKTPHPEVAFARDPAHADRFVVSDNGAGFDMRFAERLFGVFQRLHSANDFPGTGIGLASVRRIVRRHGGEIWAEAEVNRGARFHFSLPRDPAVQGRARN